MRQPEPVDIVLTNASILTGNPAQPTASAIWVHRDRIEVIGHDDSVVAAAGESARLVSLEGRTVLPGLVDSHCHLTWYGYLLSGVDCSTSAAPNITAIKDLLSTATPGPDGWVTGSGFAEYELEEHRAPTRWELDAVVPDVPCVLYQTSMHVCVVNTAGLRALGLSDDAADPPRGRLGRTEDGILDGRLFETPMLDLMQDNLQRHLRAVGGTSLIEMAATRLSSMGITSCTDASTDGRSFAAMSQAEHSGRLPIRVTCMFTFPESEALVEAGISTGFGSESLSIGAVKIWADGGMSSRTAAVDEPYLDPPGETGVLWHDTVELSRMIRRCDEAGFQVAVHAQGERAIRTVLESLGPVVAGGNHLRHRIEHGGAFRDDLREHAAAAGVVIVSQPGFISQLGDGFVEAFGEKRSSYLYPFASLERAGLVVAGSSDAPVITPSPFVGMRDAIARKTRTGQPLATEECLSARDALDLYTRNGAYAGWRETETGTLEPGKLADFVVVDRNPLLVEAEMVADTTVHATFVGGRPVFDDGLMEQSMN